MIAFIFIHGSIIYCVVSGVKGVLNPNFRPFSFKLKKKLDF